MALVEPPPERLSDYERAICYYTLPRISYPVTFGLIVAYAVCLLEAFAAVIYGLLWDHAAFAKGGAAALGAIVVFGVVVFTARALLNEIRMRRALAVARGVPDAVADIKDIPSPGIFCCVIRCTRPATCSRARTTPGPCCTSWKAPRTVRGGK